MGATRWRIAPPFVRSYALGLLLSAFLLLIEDATGGIVLTAIGRPHLIGEVGFDQAEHLTLPASGIELGFTWDGTTDDELFFHDTGGACSSVLNSEKVGFVADGPAVTSAWFEFTDAADGAWDLCWYDSSGLAYGFVSTFTVRKQYSSILVNMLASVSGGAGEILYMPASDGVTMFLMMDNGVASHTDLCFQFWDSPCSDGCIDIDGGGADTFTPATGEDVITLDLSLMAPDSYKVCYDAVTAASESGVMVKVQSELVGIEWNEASEPYRLVHGYVGVFFNEISVTSGATTSLRLVYTDDEDVCDSASGFTFSVATARYISFKSFPTFSFVNVNRVCYSTDGTNFFESGISITVQTVVGSMSVNFNPNHELAVSNMPQFDVPSFFTFYSWSSSTDAGVLITSSYDSCPTSSPDPVYIKSTSVDFPLDDSTTSFGTVPSDGITYYLCARETSSHAWTQTGITLKVTKFSGIGFNFGDVTAGHTHPGVPGDHTGETSVHISVLFQDTTSVEVTFYPSSWGSGACLDAEGSAYADASVSCPGGDCGEFYQSFENVGPWLLCVSYDSGVTWDETGIVVLTQWDMKGVKINSATITGFTEPRTLPLWALEGWTMEFGVTSNGIGDSIIGIRTDHTDSNVVCGLADSVSSSDKVTFVTGATADDISSIVLTNDDVDLSSLPSVTLCWCPASGSRCSETGVYLDTSSYVDAVHINGVEASHGHISFPQTRSDPAVYPPLSLSLSVQTSGSYKVLLTGHPDHPGLSCSCVTPPCASLDDLCLYADVHSVTLPEMYTTDFSAGTIIDETKTSLGATYELHFQVDGGRWYHPGIAISFQDKVQALQLYRLTDEKRPLLTVPASLHVTATEPSEGVHANTLVRFNGGLTSSSNVAVVYNDGGISVSTCSGYTGETSHTSTRYTVGSSTYVDDLSFVSVSFGLAGTYSVCYDSSGDGVYESTGLHIVAHDWVTGIQVNKQLPAQISAFPVGNPIDQIALSTQNEFPSKIQFRKSSDLSELADCSDACGGTCELSTEISLPAAPTVTFESLSFDFGFSTAPTIAPLTTIVMCVDPEGTGDWENSGIMLIPQDGVMELSLEGEEADASQSVDILLDDNDGAVSLYLPDVQTNGVSVRIIEDSTTSETHCFPLIEDDPAVTNYLEILSTDSVTDYYVADFWNTFGTYPYYGMYKMCYYTGFEWLDTGLTIHLGATLEAHSRSGETSGNEVTMSVDATTVSIDVTGSFQSPLLLRLVENDCDSSPKYSTLITSSLAATVTLDGDWASDAVVGDVYTWCSSTDDGVSWIDSGLNIVFFGASGTPTVSPVEGTSSVTVSVESVSDSLFSYAVTGDVAITESDCLDLGKLGTFEIEVDHSTTVTAVSCSLSESVLESELVKVYISVFAATPEISNDWVATGDVITLSTETDGAEVRYSLEEGDLTCEEGILYVEPIEITTPTIVTAIACKDDLEDSIVMQQMVSVDPYLTALSPLDVPTATDITFSVEGYGIVDDMSVALIDEATPCQDVSAEDLEFTGVMKPMTGESDALTYFGHVTIPMPSVEGSFRVCYSVGGGAQYHSIETPSGSTSVTAHDPVVLSISPQEIGLGVETEVQIVGEYLTADVEILLSDPTSESCSESSSSLRYYPLAMDKDFDDVAVISVLFEDDGSTQFGDWKICFLRDPKGGRAGYISAANLSDVALSVQQPKINDASLAEGEYVAWPRGFTVSINGTHLHSNLRLSAVGLEEESESDPCAHVAFEDAFETVVDGNTLICTIQPFSTSASPPQTLQLCVSQSSADGTIEMVSATFSGNGDLITFSVASGEVEVVGVSVMTSFTTSNVTVEGSNLQPQTRIGFASNTSCVDVQGHLSFPKTTYLRVENEVANSGVMFGIAPSMGTYSICVQYWGNGTNWSSTNLTMTVTDPVLHAFLPTQWTSVEGEIFAQVIYSGVYTSNATVAPLFVEYEYQLIDTAFKCENLGDVGESQRSFISLPAVSDDAFNETFSSNFVRVVEESTGAYALCYRRFGDNVTDSSNVWSTLKTEHDGGETAVVLCVDQEDYPEESDSESPLVVYRADSSLYREGVGHHSYFLGTIQQFPVTTFNLSQPHRFDSGVAAIPIVLLTSGSVSNVSLFYVFECHWSETHSFHALEILDDMLIDADTVNDFTITIGPALRSNVHQTEFPILSDALQSSDVVASLIEMGALVISSLSHVIPSLVSTTQSSVTVDRSVSSDQAPLLHLISTGQFSTSESGTDIVAIAVQGVEEVDEDITVYIGLAEDSDEAEVEPSTITLTQVNWQTPQLVLITGKDDVFADGNVNYTLIFEAGGVQHTVVLQNQDDDWAGVYMEVSEGNGELREGLDGMHVNVSLSAKPMSSVELRLSTNDTSEVLISTQPFRTMTETVSLRFEPNSWNISQLLYISSVRDKDNNDGRQPFEVYVSSIESKDIAFVDSFESKQFPTVSGYVYNVVFPSFIATTPEVCSMVGCNVTVYGQSIHRDAKVWIGDNDISDHVLNTTSPSALFVSDISLSLPMQNTTGYMTIKIVNPQGGWTTFEMYYSTSCPEDGWYGWGADCRQCPAGAVCPGGYRAWPLPGHWSSGEESTEVSSCPPPSGRRCLGSRFSLCAKGYHGPLCAKCEDNYYEQNGLCLSCLDAAGEEAGIIVSILSALVFLCLLGLSSIFLTAEAYDLVVWSFAQMQLFAEVGLMAQDELPQVVRDVYQYLSLTLLDINFVKPGCTVSHLDFTSVYLITISLFIAICLPNIIEITVRILISKKKDEFINTRIRSIGTLSTFVFLIFVTRALEALNCRSVDGRLTLLADVDQTCFEGPHIFISLLSIAILFGTFSFLVLGWRFVRRNRNRLAHDEKYVQRADFLYSDFKQSYYEFFLTDFAVMLFFAFAVVYLKSNPGLQSLLCMILVGLQMLWAFQSSVFVERLVAFMFYLKSVVSLGGLSLNYLANFVGESSTELDIIAKTILGFGGLYCLSVATYFVQSIRNMIVLSRSSLDAAVGSSDSADDDTIHSHTPLVSTVKRKSLSQLDKADIYADGPQDIGDASGDSSFVPSDNSETESFEAFASQSKVGVDVSSASSHSKILEEDDVTASREGVAPNTAESTEVAENAEVSRLRLGDVIGSTTPPRKRLVPIGQPTRQSGGESRSPIPGQIESPSILPALTPLSQPPELPTFGTDGDNTLFPTFGTESDNTML